jgi:hypothetical protein
MSSETQEVEQPPRMKRHRLRRGKPIRVTVERQSGSTPEEAELLDISRSGMKVAVPIHLALHEAVQLKLEVPDLDTSLSLPATVCWSRPGEGDIWRVGCQFSPPLPESTLAQLAEGGFLQRRQNPREEVAIEASIRWEAAEQSSDVRITDLSTGGFCLLCYQPGKVGDRLLLEVTDASGELTRIPARAQWQRQADEGVLTGQPLFFIGCMFLHNQGYQTLRDIARPAEIDPPAKAPAARRRRKGWWAAVAALGVAGAVLYLLLG